MKARFGEFVIDSEARQLRHGGQPVHLTPKAFDLLEYLLDRRPQVLSRPQIYDRLWPATAVAESNLASLVKEIRRALGDDARSPRFVRTAHGRGYAFSAEAAEEDEPSAAGAGGPRLVWPGHRAMLAEGDNVVGRSRTLAICVEHGSVSRRHAIVRVSAGRVTITDCASKNGTFVEGRRIRAEHTLAHGEAIQLGKVRLRFLSDSPEPSTLTVTGA